MLHSIEPLDQSSPGAKTFAAMRVALIPYMKPDSPVASNKSYHELLASFGIRAVCVVRAPCSRGCVCQCLSSTITSDSRGPYRRASWKSTHSFWFSFLSDQSSEGINAVLSATDRYIFWMTTRCWRSLESRLAARPAECFVSSSVWSCK